MPRFIGELPLTVSREIAGNTRPSSANWQTFRPFDLRSLICTEWTNSSAGTLHQSSSTAAPNLQSLWNLLHNNSSDVVTRISVLGIFFSVAAGEISVSRLVSRWNVANVSLPWTFLWPDFHEDDDVIYARCVLFVTLATDWSYILQLRDTSLLLVYLPTFTRVCLTSVSGARQTKSFLSVRSWNRTERVWQRKG